MKALINSWNDADSIGECIKSLDGFEVHVFDGRYKDFPGKSWDSTDGTKSIVESLGATFHEPVKNETQCEKRTRMMEVVEDGEYFLRIDADEVLLNPETMPKELTKDVYWAWEISNVYADPIAKPRIYKKIPGMHVAGRHHYFYDLENNLITSDQFMGWGYTHETIPMRIFNMRHLRSPDREMRKKYYRSHRDENKYNERSVYKTDQKMIPNVHRAPRPRRPVTIRKNGRADYTMSLLFTRPWAVKRFFENFDKVWIPRRTEIICIIDSNDLRLYNNVVSAISKRRMRFSAIKTFFTRNRKPGEKDVYDRRKRISQNMNIMLTEAQGKIILGAEDDSLPDDPDTYKILLQNLEEHKADMVQGTIIGRWQPIVPAWHVTMKNGELVSITTGEKKTGLEEIQGCGWYGYAAKANTMRKYPFHTLYCKFVGPDFHHGFDMWRGGAKILHNHDVSFTHFGEDWEIPIKNDTVIRRWERVSGKWRPV